MEQMKEKWKVVQENIGLIHIMAQQIISNKEELARRHDYWYDEFVSEGKFGLIKAVETYKKTQGQFSTYACGCIKNQINQYLRQEFAKTTGYTKYVDKSLDTDSKFHDEENLGTNNFYNLLFNIMDINRFEEKECILNFINIILNYLPKKLICSIFYHISGMKQDDIAKRLHISQAQTSKNIKKGIQHCREIYNMQKFNNSSSYIREANDGYILVVPKDNGFINNIQFINSFAKDSTILCKRKKEEMLIWTKFLNERFFFILAEILNN